MLVAALDGGAVFAQSGPASGTWPGWRGDGSATSRDQSAPVHWDTANGVVWKTRIAGEGNSSPIVWHDRVFLTASAEGGRKRLVICLDADTGDTLWQKPLPAEATATYPRTGHAAPTPVTDGECVYAFFDSPGLVALDYEGNVKWTKALGPFKNPYNMASSPVICGDLVVVNCDHGGPSFIVAFDRVTGDERWRTKREGGTHYATPLVFAHDGQTQIVVNGSTIVSYDADAGQRLWWSRGMKHATTPTPLYHAGLVYATCGRNGPSLAIDPSGRGDVTDTHVRMQLSSGGPYVPSPVIYQDLFVIPGDNGRMMFVDRAGKTVCRYRIRSKFTSSPVVSTGRIYWTDETGATHVITASGLNTDDPKVEVIATNPLNETSYASPAIAHGRLFIRTAKHVYCIAGGDAKIITPQPRQLPDDFVSLKALYDEQPKGEFDDTALRIAIVEKLEALDDPRAVDLLAAAAHRDGHWDVCEAAVRALGAYGPRAVPALLGMFTESRPFLKTVAAEHLAQLKPADATQTLIKSARNDELHVRVGCIKALGEIGSAHAAAAAEMTPMLIELTADGEGIVRHAAIEALSRFPDNVGAHRDDVIAAIRKRLDDPHALTAKSAKIALRRHRASSEPDKPRTPRTVAPGAELVEVYAGDFFFEGPTWDPAANRLYFTAWGGPTTKILRLEAPGEATVWMADAKGVNGTFRSRNGRLLGAQVHAHRVVSFAFGQDGPGDEKVLAEDQAWNQPNDVCQTNNGDIYFTDPDFAKRTNSAVYRLGPDGAVRKVITDMPLPNGLITSLDGKTLYVADSHQKLWRAYPIREDGSVGPGRVFFNPDTEDQRDPDGVSIDEEGNLYLTGRGGVWVVNPAGEPLGLIAIPEFCSNVTFGGADGKTLYMTCSKKVYSLRMRVRTGQSYERR